MDKNARSIFNRRRTVKTEHLKPLSVYSRMITCDQKANLNQFRNPFINLKIEINNCERKRKIDDSSLDHHDETPAKKSFRPNALSPDAGCFVDFCSPSPRQNSKSEMKQTVRGQFHWEHVDCGSSEPGDNKLTQHSEKVLFNVAPAFDGDVDDILCLNPIGTYTAGRVCDDVKSCNTFQSNPVLNPAFTRGQVKDEQEEMKKQMHLAVKDIERDKGYFSMCCTKDLKKGNDPSQSVYSELSQATSSPLLQMGKVGAPDESHQSCQKRAALSEQHVCFTVTDLDPVVSGPLFDSLNSPAEPLEGDMEEMWTIGLPIFESSVCHNVSIKLSAGSEQSRRVSEEVQGSMMDPIHECQPSLDGEETTLDTSYETTLPLQVQVKSVVVPRHHPPSSQPAAPRPKQTAEPTKWSPKETRVPQTSKCVSSARSQRPVIYHSEVDLERDKRMYLHSVNRHMNENQGAVQDVMTELLNLMTHVADQTSSTNGTQWQHPSDLTRRNYQRRFGNLVPTMTLHEWQAKNWPTHKRFAEVPKIFQRSPVL